MDDYLHADYNSRMGFHKRMKGVRKDSRRVAGYPLDLVDAWIDLAESEAVVDLVQMGSELTGRWFEPQYLDHNETEVDGW